MAVKCNRLPIGFLAPDDLLAKRLTWYNGKLDIFVDISQIKLKKKERDFKCFLFWQYFILLEAVHRFVN